MKWPGVGSHVEAYNAHEQDMDWGGQRGPSGHNMPKHQQKGRALDNCVVHAPCTLLGFLHKLPLTTPRVIVNPFDCSTADAIRPVAAGRDDLPIYMFVFVLWRTGLLDLGVSTSCFSVFHATSSIRPSRPFAVASQSRDLAVGLASVSHGNAPGPCQRLTVYCLKHPTKGSL